MRYLACCLLFVVLCSNDCNAPYNARKDCRDEGKRCQFHYSHHLEFSMKNANVSWWKGSVDIGIYYRVKNTSPDQRDSIDFSRFSAICSNGLQLVQGIAHTRSHGVTTFSPTVRSLAPGESVDSIFVFFTANNYSRKVAMELFKKERFFMRYSDELMDTLLSVTANDSKIR